MKKPNRKPAGIFPTKSSKLTERNIAAILLIRFRYGLIENSFSPKAVKLKGDLGKMSSETLDTMVTLALLAKEFGYKLPLGCLLVNAEKVERVRKKFEDEGYPPAETVRLSRSRFPGDNTGR
jgi:hypothetical protein